MTYLIINASIIVPVINSSQLHRDSLSRDQMVVISVLNIITASLSMLGSASILICVTIRRKACLAEVFPIYQLSLADLLASIMMLSGASLYLTDETDPLRYGYELNVCSIISALTKCFYINTFMLTVAYALEALLRIRLRFQSTSYSNSTQRQQNAYQAQYCIYFLSWFLPVVATVTIVALSSADPSVKGEWLIIPDDCTLCLPIFHYNPSRCWANKENGEKWVLAYRMLFVVPLLIVMATNMALYLCIFYAYRRSNMTRGLLTYHQRKEEASIRFKAILYQSVFACCWIFPLILGLIRLLDPDTKYGMSRYYGLFVVQAITAPLQGFCNSLIYGWKRKGFKDALLQTEPLNYQTQNFYNTVSI